MGMAVASNVGPVELPVRQCIAAFSRYCFIQLSCSALSSDRGTGSTLLSKMGTKDRYPPKLEAGRGEPFRCSLFGR
jgi:hypothetical protein